MPPGAEERENIVSRGDGGQLREDESAKHSCDEWGSGLIREQRRRVEGRRDRVNGEQQCVHSARPELLVRCGSF